MNVEAVAGMPPLRHQLIKWIGNKQPFAPHIIANFPPRWNTYHEPFLGSGAVLGTLAPDRALASDTLHPLIDIWRLLAHEPGQLIAAYAAYRDRIDRGEDKTAVYLAARDAFNATRSGHDFVFVVRSCYGAVIRFRQSDGAMSTPCGAHMPISTASFAKRVEAWSPRVQGTSFRTMDYTGAFGDVRRGDMVYCDPPYSDSQSIIYGAQNFRLHGLLDEIDRAKSRGARVALSIDGTKKSGLKEVLHDFPKGLFASEAPVEAGSSMLRRFQCQGTTVEHEVVRDRLLLTY